MSRASFHILSFYSLGKIYYVLIIDVDGSFVRIVITLSQTSIKYLQRIKLCLNQKKIQPYIITHTWHTLWQETYLLMKGCVLSKMCNSSTIYSNNIIIPPSGAYCIYKGTPYYGVIIHHNRTIYINCMYHKLFHTSLSLNVINMSFIYDIHMWSTPFFFLIKHVEYTYIQKECIIYWYTK